MSTVKYRHPKHPLLEWSGRGKQPLWVANWINDGGTLDDLDVAVRDRIDTQHMDDAIDDAAMASGGIDLGIGQVTDAETHNQNVLLNKLTDSTNAAVYVLGNSNTQPVAYLGITDAEHALAEFLEVDLSAEPAVLLSRIKDDSRRLLVSEIGMGLRLIALKGRLEHGEFLPAVADVGIADRAAQAAMRTASAFAAEGDARRRQQLLDMGKTKGAALLAAKPEVREQILNDPELAQEAQEASKMELLRLLKDKEEQIERHQKAYADLETQLETRKLELQKLQKVDPVTLLTRSVRAEAVANAAAIGDLCDNLIRLAEAVDDESIAADQRRLRQRAVGAAVGSAIGHLQALYTALESGLGDGIPTPTALDDLTQDEISRAVACRSFVHVQFGRRLEQRRDEAYGEHLAEGGAKKRGRPVKTQGSR